MESVDFLKMLEKGLAYKKVSLLTGALIARPFLQMSKQRMEYVGDVHPL
jgi:hypothetical protein